MSNPSSSPNSVAALDPGAGVLRVESWAGEIRVNRIRLVAIIAFYTHHLVQLYLQRHAEFPWDPRYNLGVTIVVFAWAGIVAALHVMLSRRMWMPGMKFGVVIADIALIAALGVLAGGPQTPLMLLLFAVIASAPLRMSLPLVYVATFGTWLGYLLVVAYYAWVKIGFHAYYANPQLQIPRAHEIIVLLALGAAGLMAGQVVRQARRIASGYPATLVEPPPSVETDVPATASSDSSEGA